jgi:hypothetical protein
MLVPQKARGTRRSGDAGMSKFIVVAVLLLSSVGGFSTDNKCESAKTCEQVITAQIEAISRNIDIDKQIKNEFLDMSLELAKLQDERVAEIMRPHIVKIRELEKQKSDAR